MGNICRSPTAEGCMQYHITQQQLQHYFKIDSAGTIGYHAGEAPDFRSQQYALKHEVDLSWQRARKVELIDYLNFDYVIAMDRENLWNLNQSKPSESKADLSLLTDWFPGTSFIDVPDPYYGEGDGFETVFNLVNEATLRLLEALKNKHYKAK